MKKHLEATKGKCPEELLGVLWTYRTTSKISMVETSFLLIYCTEALISVKIGEPSLRYKHRDELSNQDALRTNLDLAEKRRKLALIQMATQKQRIERYYNRKVNLRYFKIGNFVLRKVFQSTQAVNSGKLGPSWESSY